MRRLALWLFLLALATAHCVASEVTVDGLKSRLPNASPEDHAEISIRIAELQLRAADKLYTEGRVAEARAAVDDIVAYSQKSRDAAIESRKHLKNVEIAMRKMAAKLRDIQRTLTLEDQPPVDQAAHRLEDLRTTLLKEMFSDKKDKKK
ncbi:MAG: hypothetical protein WAU58_15950 [Terriglobales bacterium]